MSKRRRRKPQPAPPAKPETHRPRESFAWAALGIFGFALGIRALQLWQIRTAPFFPLVFGDGASYDTWAQGIAAGDWLGRDVFYQAPLYPYFLGAIYTVFGRDLMVLRICQAIVGSLSCALLGAAGWRLFSKRVGLVAGVLLALTAPAIFSDAVIQKSVLDFFFLCLLLWLVSGLVDEPGKRLSWLWSGFALGCLSLTRENALVFLVPILVWLVLQHRTLGKQRLALAAMLFVGLAGALLPVAARNKVVGGELLLTTSQFGPNFYIGNNPQADGTYQPLRYGRADAAFERTDATELAEQAMGRSLTPGEVSRYWTRQALDYIVSQPGDWLRLMARKFALLWNAVEAVDTESQYSYAEWSAPLRLTGYLTHLGVIAPLALFGVWVTWARREKLWLLHLMFVTYAASVLVFYVFTRYRYPLVPFLVLFASAGLVEARRFVRETAAARLVPCVGAVAALVVFSNWPILSKDWMRAATEDRWGIALQKQGDLAQAVEHFRRAVALDPESDGAHNNLGTAFHAQGNLEAAARQFREALRISPEGAAAHYNLGNVLALQGQADEAIDQYRTALGLSPDDARIYAKLATVLESQDELDEAIGYRRQVVRLAPDDDEALGSLGMALLSQGEVDEAVGHFRQALQINPGSTRILNNLGIALASSGQVDEALSRFREALQIDPDLTEVHTNLAMALGPQGQVDEAVDHLRRVVQITPDSADAHNDLGIALASRGDYEEAIGHFRQALQLDPDFAEAKANLDLAVQLAAQ